MDKNGFGGEMSVSRQARDQALFDSIALKYAKKDIHPVSRAARESELLCAMAPMLGKPASLGNILDIGCGVGAAARYLKGHYTGYTGIDQSQVMIDIARNLHKDLKNVTFKSAAVQDMDVPNGSFDTVIAIGALHHITELDSCLSSIKKAAKPGAMFMAIEPQNGNLFIQALRSIRTLLDHSYSKEQAFFSEKFLSELLKRNGIHNVSFSYQGILVPPFSQVILDPAWLFAPMERFAARADASLNRLSPGILKRLTFNIVTYARLDK
jgi:2-polyprenyl-3-methyl-5-hydroxy-6-metoxy-1,4-benzoquinol methylase